MCIAETIQYHVVGGQHAVMKQLMMHFPSVRIYKFTVAVGKM